VEPKLLWTKYPHAYHMAQLGSWPSISQLGLLSTSALLDLFEVSGEERLRIETRRRPESVTLNHAIHGTVVIRDQKPLSESRLARCLEGLSVQAWFRLLNERTFVWLEQKRLNVLRGAEAYRAERQTVITLDTKRLVEAYGSTILITHMNTGATRPFAHPRGSDTFRKIEDYPFDARKRVVELTISHGVPDIKRFTIRVQELGGDQPPTTIWGA
jgi:hypothetical protein